MRVWPASIVGSPRQSLMRPSARWGAPSAGGGRQAAAAMAASTTRADLRTDADWTFIPSVLPFADRAWAILVPLTGFRPASEGIRSHKHPHWTRANHPRE